MEHAISKVILRKVAIPLCEPFRISNGEVSIKESVIIELHSKFGIGYGEASPMSGSFYSPETPASTWDALCNDLVPTLLNAPGLSTNQLVHLLDDYAREPFARAGLEGALWHLQAIQEARSIGSIFGAPRARIPSGLAIGLYDTIEELLERIALHYPKGYQRLKIKIMPGWDIEPLMAIRERFGMIPLMVDANAAYTWEEHRALLQSLDQFEMLMIEQPLARDAFADMGALAQTMRTPICADESAESMPALEAIIKHRSAAIINIKVQRVGGLATAVKMHDRAVQMGLKCWLGTMPELGIASAQALQIASLPGFVFPTDVEESDRWFCDDLIDPKITISSAGLIDIPGDLGFGYQVSLSRLEEYTKQTIEFLP